MLTSLKLKGYIPLKNKGVNSISLSTKSIFNIIFGRNGYGKTSLLREMSPLPPDNSDFEDGGYKEVTFKIGHNIFKLASTTGKKSSHYFYLNNVNLNTGNTLLVQKELVKQYFKINNDIKGVLTGLDLSDRFSSLPPQRRKSVLMDINPNDTSYALKIFEKTKTALNHTRGALKHQTQRLASELKRQEDFEKMDSIELQFQINKLDKQIKEAFIIHGSLQSINEPKIEPIKRKMEDILARLTCNTSKTLYTASYYVELIERVQRYLFKEKTRQSALQTLIESTTDKVNNLNIPEGFSLQEYEYKIEDIEKKILTLSNEKNETLKEIEKEEFFKDDKWKTDSFYNEINNLLDNIINVEISTDKDISSALYLQKQELVKGLMNELDVKEKKIGDLRHLLNHYQNTDLTTCPNCNANFKIGFEKVDITKVKDEIDLLIVKVELLNQNVKNINKYLEDNEGWFETMKSLMLFLKYSINSKYILELVKYFEIGKKQPLILVNKLKLIRKHFELDKEQELLIQEQTKLKAQYSLMCDKDVQSLYKDLEDLSIELGRVQRNISRYNKDIQCWENKIEEVKADEFLRDQYFILFEELNEQLILEGKWEIKNKVVERINELTPRKEAIMSQLIRSESFKSIIKSIEDSVEELKKREKHLKAIMDGLSPVKGLIGYLMIDFLNSLCANVNAGISAIWTDNLKLLSCHTDESNIDLDYKFPVITTNPKKPTEDIKKCSGGEKEIIDFFIRKTLLRYKGERCGIPLDMDEVGITFDELHRGRFFSYISEQLRLDKLPQTFMISHYVNQYNRFNNEDINLIALNTEGLNVPRNLNTNTEINK